MKKKITIVGPVNSPNDELNKSLKNNIDAIFLMAKYNKKFKEIFLKNKENAINEVGFNLSKSEKLIIDNIGEKKLKKIIESYKFPGVTKKSLINWKSAAAVLLLLSSLAITTEGCKSHKHLTRGINTPSFAIDEKKIIKLINPFDSNI